MTFKDKFIRKMDEKMKKITEISILKALAAILVIIIHVSATPVVTLTNGLYFDIVLFLNRFAKPSVPMFVFASGLTLYYSYQKKEFKYGRFIKKRLMTVVIPYVVWCCLYYAYFLATGAYSLSIKFLIYNILTGSMIYHLYFIVIIIQFYFLFGIIRYVMNRFNPHIVLGISFIISLLSIQYIHFAFMDRSFLTYLTFFMLGCWFSSNLERAKDMVYRYKAYITGAFFMAGAYFSYQFYRTQVMRDQISGFLQLATFIVFSLIGILFYYYISCWIEEKTAEKEKEMDSGESQVLVLTQSKIRSSILKVSDASFYIYLSHPLALLVCGGILKRVGITGVLDRFVICILFIIVTVFPLSIIYTNLRKKWIEKSRKMAYNN